MARELDELAEWAFEKARIHHQLAVDTDSEDMRTGHIASSSAYRELALEIQSRASKQQKEQP